MAILSNGVLKVEPSDYSDPAGLQFGTVWWPDDGSYLLHQHATYAQIYRSKLWVATLTNKLGSSLSRLPFKPYYRGNAGRQSARGSGFGRLMANPCPIPSVDPVFFWLWTASVFELYGEAVWIKLRDPRTKLPVALFPMHPANLQIRRTDDGGRVYEWRLTATSVGQTITWSADDVVHFKTFNPDTIARGLSRLQPLHATLVAETAMRTSQDSMWANGARPSVVLKHPNELTPQAKARLRAEWNATHGGVGNHGKAMVLEEAMDAQVIQLAPAEMQYLESLKMGRDDACSLFDVPPPVVHILDRATFSNITEQMRSMYRDTMGLRLPAFESAVVSQLAAEFGDRYYGEFLLDDVLRGDFEARWNTYRIAHQIAGMSPAEIRAAENLPYAGPATEELFVNSAMVPIPLAGKVTQRPGLSNDATKAANLRDVMGRLGRAKSPTELDLGTVTSGLDAELAQIVALHVASASNEGHDMATLRENLTTALTEELV